jgi:TRAP-type C4-dicarboxylate transport system substrate-binding protein
MKRWTICLTLLLILSVVMSLATACSKSTSPSTTSSTPAATKAPEKIILKLAVGIPPHDPMVQALFAWADVFNAAAGDRAEMQVFAGGSLAGTTDTFAATMSKVCEIGHISVPTLVGYDPIFGVSNLPYLLDTYEANYEFCRLIQDYLSNVMETKFNQKLLSVWSMGFGELYTTGKQVRTMEDVKGLVIACDKAIDARVAQALGGSPVTMDFTEEYPSLEKGVVNAGMTTVGGALGLMKYYEVIKWLTISSKSGGMGGVTINLDAWDSLPADLQQIMVEQGNKYTDDMEQVQLDFWQGGYKTCEENGVTLYYLPEDERARWQAICEPIVEEYWKEIGDEAAKKMQAWAAEANAKYPYQAR